MEGAGEMDNVEDDEMDDMPPVVGMMVLTRSIYGFVRRFPWGHEELWKLPKFIRKHIIISFEAACIFQMMLHHPPQKS
jgi:hypothetical protein